MAGSSSRACASRRSRGPALSRASSLPQPASRTHSLRPDRPGCGGGVPVLAARRSKGNKPAATGRLAKQEARRAPGRGCGTAEQRRHDPAPAFSRCCHVRWSGPGSGLPASRARGRELVSWLSAAEGGGALGVPAPPPPQRRPPLAAARRPRPRAAGAPGARCAPASSRAAPPRPPPRSPSSLAHLGFLHSSATSFFILSSPLPKPRPEQAKISVSRQGAPHQASRRCLGREQRAPEPRGRPGEAVRCEQRVITTCSRNHAGQALLACPLNPHTDPKIIGNP